MKRIYAGFMIVILLAAGVGAATYAFLFDNATVEGISISTGNADIQIWDGSEYKDYWFVGAALNGLYPGASEIVDAKLKNASTSDIPLKVSLQLTSAGGDWGALKDAIKIKVADNTNTTVYLNKTLSELNSQAWDFGPDIPFGGDQEYKITVYIPDSFGNEIKNKTINPVQFVITGTQD